ncbi:Alpha/beta hydrolase fold-1 [Aspergillus pseudoustus]|uniref:Alpha/beta hydrolase fold-1 n=1 Tax=Aspergillus pseudoustus TaxID=1810923 RepID=A0ABR4K6Z9_9EURO
MPSQKPTLIFAPGAWYPTTAFTPLTTILESHGYTCHTIAFPSIQQATTVTDLSADIAAVRALVEPEVQKGNDVVIIVHSWAGLPVNSALTGLEKTSSEGGKGGVVKLVFISAFIPEIGQSLVSAFGGTPAPWYVRDELNGTVSAATPFDLFFHDVPNGEEWAGKLRPHAWATKISPATGAAYQAIPSLYLHCEHDRAIPIEIQKLMVEKARSQGAKIATESIATGHTPWLVDAERVEGYIRREIGNV